MKIGLFTDSHYSSAKITCGRRYNSRSLAKIEQAMCCFQKENCELVICLGDLIDREDEQKKVLSNLHEVAEVFHRYNLPLICLMGNHDAFTLTQKAFYGVLGEECRPRPIRTESRTLLFLDCCYTSDGAHYKPEGFHDWTDTFLPQPQELKRTLEECDTPVCLFMHQNVSPGIRSDHCLTNAWAVRKLVVESGKVEKVFQGHYHPGQKESSHGIEYITFPAMCEQEEAWFILEL